MSRKRLGRRDRIRLNLSALGLLLGFSLVSAIPARSLVKPGDLSAKTTPRKWPAS